MIPFLKIILFDSSQICETYIHCLEEVCFMAPKQPGLKLIKSQKYWIIYIHTQYHSYIISVFIIYVQFAYSSNKNLINNSLEHYSTLLTLAHNSLQENFQTRPSLQYTRATKRTICDPIQQKVHLVFFWKKMRFLHYLTEDLTSFPIIPNS